MATIYLNTDYNNTKDAILAPREFWMRPFDFDDTWTELRLGMYVSMTSVSNPNDRPADDSLVVSNMSDRVAFGIKSNTSDIPGIVGTDFLGIITPNGQNAVQKSGGTENYLGATTSLQQAGATVRGVTLTEGSATNGAGWSQEIVNPIYKGFWTVKLVIANRGLSSQTVAISAATDGHSGNSSTPTPANLRLAIAGASYVSLGSPFAWNNGSVAYDIPTCFYIRFPFYSTRFRLSCVQAIRFA